MNAQTTTAELRTRLEAAEAEARALRDRRDEQQANLTNLRGQRDAERQRVLTLPGGKSRELKDLQAAITAVETLVETAEQRIRALDQEIERLHAALDAERDQGKG